MTAGAGNATREHVFPVIVVGAGPGGLAVGPTRLVLRAWAQADRPADRDRRTETQ